MNDSIKGQRRSDFTGTEDEWAVLRATAAFAIKTGREETIFTAADDLAEGAGKEPYGDKVPYVDPGYIDGVKRYPIDCKHVKAALSYIGQKKNAARYTAKQLAHIKGRINAAYKKCFGEEPPSAE